MKVVQLLGLQGPWRHQVFRDTDCLCGRSYAPIRVIFWASCSWWSEGLLGQSFSVALPVQALRGLLCLGSFSAVPRVRHIEGPPLTGVPLCRSAHQALKGAPRVGSYSSSVHQAFDGPAYLLFSYASAGMWRERGYGDGSTHYAWLSSITCFHGCPALLHRHFPPQSLPSHVLNLALRSQQQPLPWDCSIIPELQLPAIAPSRRSCLAYVWLQQGLSYSHSI